MQVKDRVREDDGDKQELVLTLVASADEVKEAADKFFAEIAQRDIPGFRKGKAPRAVLEQNVGGHKNAMGGVAEMLINEKAFKALDDADVIFVGEPDFNVDNDVVEGQPFTFAVSGAVVPQMKLSSYDGVSIEMPPDEATDAEVERQLKHLQDVYHSFEKIDDPEHVAEMPASFDEHLVGSKLGDTLEFDFEAKDEEGNTQFGDGQLHANVEIQEFRRKIVPEIGDELAAKVGCMDAEDMRKQMRHQINQHKEAELPGLMVQRAVDALADRLVGDVPQYYVDFIRQDVGREMMQSFEKQGTSLQEWLLNNNGKADEIKENVTQEAIRRARIDCALEALVAEKGFDVTEEDIEKELAQEDDAIATREKWEKANRMAELRKVCRHSKASRWLVQTAEVTVVDVEA